MVPCRQLFMWSVPSIAVLLGIFWFRKKREFAKSDPGGRERIKCLQEELAEALKAEIEANSASPVGRAERSIIKSSPIDIVPRGSSSQRSSSLELTDEEIDLEIEKIIRKKSLDKDKRASYVGSQKIVMSLAPKQGSFIVKESPLKQLSVNEPEMALKKNDFEQISCQSDGDTNVGISKEVSGSLEASPPSCTRFESASSTGDTIEESTTVDTEELQTNNNLDDQPSDSSDSGNNRYSTTPTRRISERDSANHSPVDPILASPSMCHFSDNHSEGSSDSGKGCSEAASPPPAGMNIVPAEGGLRVHQFLISQALVGLLIGKQGSFVTQIKAKTGASVNVRRHPDSMKQKICAVEGTQSEIEAALDMIREKFPEKRFPNFSLQEISAELCQRLVPLVPEFLQLQLVESVNNDTIMTCLVSAGHFFLQQPLHPTFPSLHALHRLMAATYQNPDVPALPRPVKEGSICAAPTENNWYRAQVISTSEDNDTSVVKLVDFGGYLTVDNDQLKQIRSDFMTLPFQATEALLAFVKPANNG
ncbi:hypothetical protein MSG28_013524 [Choristoneura fumiferana]|uniref:Uncharacterized protein n=1 Tax=Choristoneura fumiferana TaxID=7141 RepID=A0ACC0K8F7_CHOFU|nr:hypothetical protein MSG28_013524 [Choristoneura fumiferana]